MATRTLTPVAPVELDQSVPNQLRVRVPLATTSAAGLLAAADKQKLDGLDAALAGKADDGDVTALAGSVATALAGKADASALATATTALTNLQGATSAAITALADAATVTWDTQSRLAPRAKVTLGGNRTLAITNLVDGQSGVLIVRQDATGGRTLALPAGSLVLEGPLALNTAANGVTVLTYVNDGGTLLWSFGRVV